MEEKPKNRMPQKCQCQKESSSKGNIIKSEDRWKCPICLDTLVQPVVTHCGHVFCWPCVHEWLQQSKTCPVCHCAINPSQLIPIYGQGEEADLSTPPPPRPEYLEADSSTFDFEFHGNPFTNTPRANVPPLRPIIEFTPEFFVELISFAFLFITFWVR